MLTLIQPATLGVRTPPRCCNLHRLGAVSNRPFEMEAQKSHETSTTLVMARKVRKKCSFHVNHGWPAQSLDGTFISLQVSFSNEYMNQQCPTRVQICIYIYILWCFTVIFYLCIYIYTYTNKIQTSSINVYSILICHTSHGQSAEWELFRPGLSQKFWRMFTKISVQYDIINQFHGVWEPQICQCFQRRKLKKFEENVWGKFL